MSESSRKEYNKLMMELYKENQSFLNKAIFGVSTLTIPFLFNVLRTNEHSFIVSLLLAISLVFFVGVILFQIISLKLARDGCDKSIEKKETSVEDGESLFNKARTLDILREWFFIGGLFIIIVSMFTGIIQKEMKMLGNNSKEMQNLRTKSQAEVTGKKSFVPPKSTVNQNKPAESVKPVSQPQSDDAENN